MNNQIPICGKPEELTRDDKIEGTKKRLGAFFIIGPLDVLMNLAINLIETVVTDLIVHRTCVVSMNINATECFELRTNAGSPEAKILEAKVEPHASMIVMADALTRNILPAALTLFLGSWSDRFGRRLLFLASFYGLTVSCVIYFMVALWDGSPWYLLIALIPFEIVGGYQTKKLAAACYVSDRTPVRYRSLNFVSLEATYFVSQILGRLAGPLIYKNYGYAANFSAAAICGIFGILYTHLFLTESLKIDPKNSKHGLFEVSRVKELFNSCLVKRKGFNRRLTWLAIATMTTLSMIQKGHNTIQFLFTRAGLGWDVRQFSFYSATNSAVHIIGLGGVVLRSYVSDTFLGALSLLSSLGAAAAKSLAWQTWHMYLAVCIHIFNGLMIPVMRTVISKSVPAEDTGKVFALVSLLQTLSSSVASPIYVFVYSRYLPPIYPSPVFLLSISLYELITIFMIYIEILTRKSRKPPTYTAAPQEDHLSRIEPDDTE